MSAIPSQDVTSRQPSMPPRDAPIRRLTVDEFHKLYDARILVEEGLELLDGVIYFKGSGRERPIGLSDYHRMLEIGILHEGDPVELVDGMMRYKMTKGTLHDSTIDILNDLLMPLLPGWRVRIQSAMSAMTNEPEPDLVIAKGPASRYQDHHPRPEEIAIVVEVADSSAYYDRGLKKTAYARAGIIEYWVVSIPDRAIYVYTEPSGPQVMPTYHSERKYQLDESVPLNVEGRELGLIPVSAVILR